MLPTLLKYPSKSHRKTIKIPCESVELAEFLGIEFGFKETQMGILWAVIFILSAFASQLTPKLKVFFKSHNPIFIVGIIIAITLLLSPIAGLTLGFLTLLLRTSLQGIFSNQSSENINSFTESKYRATTLSTYNMIKNLPYVLTAFLAGKYSDLLGARHLSLILGIILITLLIIYLVSSKKKNS